MVQLTKINHALLTVLLAVVILFVGLLTYVKLVDTYLKYQANAERGFRDAPVDLVLQDNVAPFIVNMPDKFANLALKCLEGDLMVSHTRNGAIVVAPNASVCLPGAAERVGVPRIRHPLAR